MSIASRGAQRSAAQSRANAVGCPISPVRPFPAGFSFTRSSFSRVSFLPVSSGVPPWVRRGRFANRCRRAVVCWTVVVRHQLLSGLVPRALASAPPTESCLFDGGEQAGPAPIALRAKRIGVKAQPCQLQLRAGAARSQIFSGFFPWWWLGPRWGCWLSWFRVPRSGFTRAPSRGLPWWRGRCASATGQSPAGGRGR